MRTDEQIEKIKKYESSPIQLLNVISKEKVKSLINFHNQNNKVEKNTGPVVSYVKEGAGIIDDILELIDNLNNNSGASTPATLGTTRSILVIPVIANNNPLIYLCRIERGTVGNFSSFKCLTIALTITLFNCPWFTAE